MTSLELLQNQWLWRTHQAQVEWSVWSTRHIQPLLMGTIWVSFPFHSSSFVAYAELMCQNEFHEFCRSRTLSNFHTKKAKWVLSTPLPRMIDLLLSSFYLRLLDQYLRLVHFVPTFQVSSIATPFSSTGILTTSPDRRMKLYPALAVHRCPTYLDFQLLQV